MLIAIDYDDTFTTDPTTWRQIIYVLQAYGHEVVCVSARYNTFDNKRELEEAIGLGVEVVLCGHNAKAEVMAKRGTPVDIWIDNNPNAIDPDKKYYA